MPTDSAHHAQRPHTLSLGGCSRVVCVLGPLPGEPQTAQLPVGRGPQSQRAVAAGVDAAARGQRCSVQAQGQSGTACSSTVPGPQTGQVERAFSVGWTGDACPSPAPQTCPAPLSLAFAYLFICWEGVH